MALIYKPREAETIRPRLTPPGKITMYWRSLKPEQQKQVTDLGWKEEDVYALEALCGAVIQLKLTGVVCGMKTEKGGKFLQLISKPAAKLDKPVVSATINQGQ